MTTNHTDLIERLREDAGVMESGGYDGPARRLRAAADALEAMWTETGRLVDKSNAYIVENSRLASALEAMQADAARYRWLRGGADIPLESNRWARWEVRYWCGRWWSTMFADQLDTAIDAARGKV